MDRKETKQNCWEFKKCGRGLGEGRDNSKEQCPASQEERLDSIHDGTNSGRACWVVAGTFCGGKSQGTYAAKQNFCKKCNFYKQVAKEEADNFEQPLTLLSKLKKPAQRIDISKRKLGVIIGGSGLIGGTLNHYFKTKSPDEIEILSPNSKKLSLREPDDIRQYFQKYQPDFIVNSAISALDGDAQLTYVTNYLGCINLAKVAMALKIPYIHFSSAATMPNGENLDENQAMNLSAGLANYAKSKLMAEKTLQHLHNTRGLDYTIVKLAVVYGKHDHKIQGFHRLLYTIASQAMLFMLTGKGVRHSYTNTKKIPPFVHYLINNREEFSGQEYHFVDPEPVELRSLILAIKSHLQIGIPKEVYVSYPLAKFGIKVLGVILKGLNKIGIEARLPPELMFMESFYKTQTLSMDKLAQTSYGIPEREQTIFTELPAIIDYYITRWEHLNLISAYDLPRTDPLQQAELFSEAPQTLIDRIHRGQIDPLADFEDLKTTDPPEKENC